LSDTKNNEEAEADDVIASVVELVKANRPGCTIVIVSSDKDLWQLVEPNVEVYLPTRGRFVTQDLIMEEYGVVDPRRVALYKALWGDSGDNIPNAVPRMQRQLLPIVNACTNPTLASFIEWAEYGIQNGHVNEKAQKLLRAGAEIIERNWKLVQLDRNLDFVVVSHPRVKINANTQ
jgi:5'-3' exonuclease